MEARAIRVVVDLNRCQAYAQCCFAAPSSFVLRGTETLHFDPAPPPERQGEIERAMNACPVRAIRVEVVADRPAGSRNDG